MIKMLYKKITSAIGKPKPIEIEETGNVPKYFIGQIVFVETQNLDIGFVCKTILNVKIVDINFLTTPCTYKISLIDGTHLGWYAESILSDIRKVETKSINTLPSLADIYNFRIRPF